MKNLDLTLLAVRKEFLAANNLVDRCRVFSLCGFCGRGHGHSVPVCTE